ncbi:PLC-like phosphodiesterase [Lophiotrema nucula]|uniref:PLC-like phosphodiesterase n=1 Tax=Lophiotrema nucula TaxID=690887 RepID=A0A6A5Z9H6_9PLEO|nr:PLC-like phosphodiesterase [Lophiotrema nucula]
MSLLKSLLTLPILFAHHAYAQSQSEAASTLAVTDIPSSLLVPSGPYRSDYDLGTASVTASTVGASNATATYSSTSSVQLIGITGGASSTTNASASGTSTSSASRPSNTQPCNGWPEFCNRKLSNISMVVAHNSPFVVAHNAASNQVLKVETQLNDGIRGLQFETHVVNDTLHLCHTSCDLLDAGTLEAYLTTVAKWLDANPYEVIAIIMGNDNRVSPTTYVEPFQKSGMSQHLYTPSSDSLALDEWPTLAEMIIAGKRVIVMLDYLANQTEVPWLLDEFSYQWETPFSPTDPAFPCTQQRPPNQSNDVSRNKMFMLNHNLNIAIDISGTELLIPAFTLLDQINADSGNSSLGTNVENCTAMWGRPPNWLLVDYYNFGKFNGSVFEVAATANNVSYNRDSCCGTDGKSGITRLAPSTWVAAALTMFLMAFL